MRITLYQADTRWLRPDENYQQIEQQLQSHPESDLLILPEMCSTGFVTSPKAGQLEPASEVESRLLDLARRYDCALCGSFAVADGGRYYNRAYFEMPDGRVAHYDKRHPFNPGGEGRSYTAGQSHTVVEYQGVRFLLCVCYDLRFPVWLRWTPELPYDVLVCVANWPQQRQLAWETLLRARAIENQVYVVGVNRVGQDDLCPYQGGTKAIHPYGHVVAEVPDGAAATCSFEPDMAGLAHFREKFPSQADSDRFALIY